MGHDHQAPFLVVVLGVLDVLVLVGFQAVTRGENKLPHDYYTMDPPDFYQF